MSLQRFIVVFAVVLFVGNVARAQQCPYAEPASDWCSSPRVIPGSVGHHVIQMDANGATGALDHGCYTDFGKNVWFEITPEVTGWVTVSTCHPATSYDTVLRAWLEGDQWCEGMLPACEFDDYFDDPNCQNACYWGSAYMFSALAGTRYRFEVAAHNGNAVGCPMCLGLIVSVGTPCGEPPRNVACELARELPGAPGTHTASVDVEGAIGPSFQPTQCVGSTPVGHSVWFKTTPIVDGPLTFSTCNPGTSYDTVIQAFEGYSCDLMMILPCVDDTFDDPACDTGCGSPNRRGSSLTIDAMAGITYYFQVSSYGNNSVGCDLCLEVSSTLAECIDAGDCDDSDPCTEDSCSSGVCGHFPDEGAACPDDGNPCTEDVCNLYGECEHPAWYADYPCGDSRLTPCDNPDSCDGLGHCLPNHKPAGTACTPDDFPCTLDQCDGIGTCRHPNAPDGSSCGSATSTTCDNPDTCFNGQCVPNLKPAGTLCRDLAGPCDVREGCTGGSPNCPADGFLAGTVCRAAAGVCDVAELCTGNAPSCPANQYATSGTPCPDDGDVCTRDLCNGTGTCMHPPITGCCPSQYECCENADCDDELFCNGIETCASHICQTGAPPCAAGTACVEEQDRCGPDCNHNAVDDLIDLETKTSLDCNHNVQPDECDIAAGAVPDCNSNGVPDACDLQAGNSKDENGNGRPDECDEVEAAIVRINEVMPRPGTGEWQWVEFYTGLRGSVAGWQFVFGNGTIYSIPMGVPALPPGCFVLIVLDGAGAGGNDLNPADGLIVLHTPAGVVNPLNQIQDSIALYLAGDRSPTSLRDFFAYGAQPGAAANHAVTAGLWQPSWWVSLHPGSGAEAEGAAPVLRISAGLLPGRVARDPDQWIVYREDDRSPGRVNGIPRATFRTIQDGAEFGSDGVAIGWSLVPGGEYHLQVDDDPAFGSPVIDVLLDNPFWRPTAPPTPGTYWWRVKSSDTPGRASQWSAAQRFHVIAPDTTAAGGQQNVLSILWKRQRKDTRLLCLDGDAEGNPAQAPPKETWDAGHPDAIYTHGQLNCFRACTSMIVGSLGGNLSQDRISYEYFERNGNPIKNWGGVGDPTKDLGHNMSTIVCGTDGATGGRLFEWALGVAQTAVTYGYGKPTFTQVRGWIDAGRPISRFDGISHQTVIGGYRILGDGTQQIRLLDPWSGTTWETYSSLPVGCHYVAPATAPNRRSDEVGINVDSDGDSVMNWDEEIRFHTNPNLADSDDDFVPDRNDLREYVFDLVGGYSLRSADIDNDGLRKERDDDNDDDWALDGCEDTNRNGKCEFDVGETDNFDGDSCGTNCGDFEPNEMEEQAYLIQPGTLRSSIGPGDIDCFAFQPNDVVDVQLRITFHPEPGNNVGAVVDHLWTLAESPAGTLAFNQNRMPSGRHVFCVSGESFTARNCYRVELSLTPSVIAADAFDDQFPQGEQRNDALGTAAVLPDIFASVPYPSASLTLDLNHDTPSDIDFFTIQISPEMEPGEECCAPPLAPEQRQGHFRVLIYPEASRPFQVRLYRPDGSLVTTSWGLYHLFECPHTDFPDGRITFSIRDPGGRSLYQALIGYSHCYSRIYPDWFLEYEPPLLKWEIPELVNDYRLVYPMDPDVVQRYFAGTQTEPFPSEFGIVSTLPIPLPQPPDYKLDIRLPRGGPLALALVNEDGNTIADAFDVGGAVGSAEGSAPGTRKRLEAYDLPPGMYFLRVSGGTFGTPYILDRDLDGDFDSDSAIDLWDAAELQNCFSPIGPQPPNECAEGDLSGDGRIDLHDAAGIMRSMTGPQ